MKTESKIKNKITPFLWFGEDAEEAMKFYTSVFKNSRILYIKRWENAGPGPDGNVMTGMMEIEGQQYMVLSGGAPFTQFTEAFSFYINCDTQQEVDYYWDKLSEGGQLQQCGWLKDKFGVSWQIIPKVLDIFMDDPDKEKAGRVMNAMLQMVKLDIATLEKAYQGG